METAQEREQLQGWPFHAMPPSFDAGSSTISSDFPLFGWEPPFGCFGVADAHLHGLFPLCMEPLPLSPAGDFAPEQQQQSLPAPAMPNGELGDLLLNFWDANINNYGEQEQEQEQEQAVAINSSCVAPQQHEKSSHSSAATAANSFLFDDDDDDPLGSIFSRRPTLAEEPPVFLAPAEEPLLSSSSSSSCHADPPASGAQPQDPTPEPSGARAPPLSSSSSSLKRATPEVSESTEAECSQSGGGKRRKATPAVSVLCPFAVLKPDGLDGGATLADINARMHMRPTRPVRHPVGEFACAPRVLAADAPGLSGRAVAGFTTLHTRGRGTITIMRTRG